MGFLVSKAGIGLHRYEDLKKQLLAAQNLAEQEGDQQELARAAAAVARLTFPSGNVEPRQTAKVSAGTLTTLHVTLPGTWCPLHAYCNADTQVATVAWLGCSFLVALLVVLINAQFAKLCFSVTCVVNKCWLDGHHSA